MDVATALGTYLDIVDAEAPGLVEGLYVVGSFALGDWHPERSDIDIVAVSAEPGTDDDAGRLRVVHALLAERQPAPHVDGPYLAWGDLLIEPATGLHRPWVLQGGFHHDGDCFEINPVTWYTLATYGVTVRGPSPAELAIPTDVNARVQFVVQNLQTYWADVARSVIAACESTTPSAFDAGSLEWCTLGCLRLHYTAFTGDVVSKRGAGEYGFQVAPVEFHPVLGAALDIRKHGGTDVPLELMRQAAELIAWTVAEVTTATE
jgi:hypothetical protein